ncbi:hypothetical protein NDN08_003984 [Rhodosorus marinus]|uniref:SAP domain-containing protein n=1 Tax=Rhodosorus marinus TaxID=101924 RepID=A0AAV8UKZ9_9RHOD|nr:hypothetical protein NDN08_003984 [Rhodosorus marinus]
MSAASGEPAAAPPSSPLANEELEEEGVRADSEVFADEKVGQMEDTAGENGSMHREEDDLDEDPFTDPPHGIFARTFKKIITGVLRSVPSTPAKGGDDSTEEAGETPEEREERDDNADAPQEVAEVKRTSGPTEEPVKVEERKNLDLLPMVLRTRSRDRDPVSSKELRSVKETTPAAHQRTGMSVTHSQDSRPGSVRTENINLEDLDSIEVHRLTYKQLQHVCKHHKLLANGKKVVLRQRLRNYINKQRKVDHMSTRNTEQEMREIYPKVAVDQAFDGRYEEDGMSRVDTSGPAKMPLPMTTRKRTREIGSIEPIVTGENSIQKSQDGTVREDNKDPQGDLIGSGLNYVVEISSAVKRQRKSITASEFEVFTRVLLDGVQSEDRDQAVDTLNKLYQKASPTPRKQKMSVDDVHSVTKEHGEAPLEHATQMDTQMLVGEGQSSLPPLSAERLQGLPKTRQPRSRHLGQTVTQQRAAPKQKPGVESREEIDAVSPVEFEFRTPTNQRQNVPSSIVPIASEAKGSPGPSPRIRKSSEMAEPEVKAIPVKSTEDGYPEGHAEKTPLPNPRRTPRKTAGNIVEEFLQSSSTFIPKSADRAGANGFMDGGFTFEKGTSASAPRRSRRRPPSRVSLGQWRRKTEIREPENVQYSDLRGSYTSPASKEVVFSASSKRIMESLEKLSTPQVGSKRSRTANFGEGSGPYTEPKMQTRRELNNKPLQPGALFINSPVEEDKREQVAEESTDVHEAEPESRLQRIRRQAKTRIAENKATAVNAKPIYVPEPDEQDEARDKLAEALKQKSEQPAANVVGLEPTKKRRFVSSAGDSPSTFKPPVGVAPPVTRAKAALLAKAGTTAPDASIGTSGARAKTVGFDPVVVSAKPDFKFAVPSEPKKTNFGTGFGFSAVDAKKAVPATTESGEKDEEVDIFNQPKNEEEEKQTAEADKTEGEQDEQSEKSDEGTPPPIVLGGVAPLPEPNFTTTPLATFSGFETSQPTGGSSALLPTGTEFIFGGAQESAKEEADQKKEGQNGVEADEDQTQKTAVAKDLEDVKKEAPVQIPSSGFVFTPPKAEPEKPSKPLSTGTTWSQPSTFALSSSSGEAKSFSFTAASSSGDAKDALLQGTLNSGTMKPLSEAETKTSSGAMPPSFSIPVASAAPPDGKDNAIGELHRKTDAAEKSSGSDAFGASGTAGSAGVAFGLGKGLKSPESTLTTAPSLISSAFMTSGTDSEAASTPNAGFSASLGRSALESAAPLFSTATQASAPVTTLPSSSAANASAAALAASSASQSTEADAKAAFSTPDSFPKPSFTASTMTTAATSGFGVATGSSFRSPFSSTAEVAGASTGFTFGSVGTFGSKPEAAKENETADAVGAGVSAPAIGSGVAFGGLAAASGASAASALASISTGSTSATPAFSSVLGNALSSGTGSIAAATSEKPAFGSGVGTAFMSFTTASTTVDGGSNNLGMGTPAGGNQSAAAKDATPSMAFPAFGAASSAAPSFSTNFGSTIGSAPAFGTSNFSFQPASESFGQGQSSSAFQAPTFGSAPSTAASSAPGGFGSSSVFNANMPPPTSVFTASASTGMSGFSSSSGAMSGNASSTAPAFGASTVAFGAGAGTAPAFTANAPAGGFSFSGSTSSQPAFSGFGQGHQAPQSGSAPMGFESGQNNSFSFGGSSGGDGSGEGGFSVGANAARGRKIFRANRRRRG